MDSSCGPANLIANGDFSRGQAGSVPEGWEVTCPQPHLAPRFSLVVDGDGRRALCAAGNGRRECFGYAHHRVHLEPGKTYLMRVRLRAEGLDDLNRHLVHGVFCGDPIFNNGIFAYRRQGDTVLGENRFPGPEAAAEAEVRLYFRFSPGGKVWWEEVALEECEPIAARRVKLACAWGTGDLAHWGWWLDAAGARGCDLALLPEVFNGKGPRDAEPLDGPSGTLMAEKARQWRMYVSGTFYEQRGDLVFNTAPLFDRFGKLVGTYEKNQLFDPELDDGATPGTGFPVFDTDLGKVGMIICYDSWFPEATRLLAYRGAEIVLFPNAGYFTGLLPARAADNGVWFVVSSLNGPAGIWDPSGACAGEPDPNPTRHAPCSIHGFERDEDLKMVTATVDLSQRHSPHCWGGPMRSAPAARRCRQTLIEPIEPLIVAEARRWWDG